MSHDKTPSSSSDRHDFLNKLPKADGKSAAPPTITLLMSTSLTSNAITESVWGTRTGGPSIGKRQVKPSDSSGEIEALGGGDAVGPAPQGLRLAYSRRPGRSNSKALITPAASPVPPL